jgi:hypothetical protein
VQLLVTKEVEVFWKKLEDIGDIGAAEKGLNWCSGERTEVEQKRRRDA